MCSHICRGNRRTELPDSGRSTALKRRRSWWPVSPLAQLDLCALLGISFCGRHEGKHIVHARPDWADGHTLVVAPGWTG